MKMETKFGIKYRTYRDVNTDYFLVDPKTKKTGMTRKEAEKTIAKMKKEVDSKKVFAHKLELVRFKGGKVELVKKMI